MSTRQKIHMFNKKPLFAIIICCGMLSKGYSEGWHLNDGWVDSAGPRSVTIHSGEDYANGMGLSPNGNNIYVVTTPRDVTGGELKKCSIGGNCTTIDQYGYSDPQMPAFDDYGNGVVVGGGVVWFYKGGNDGNPVYFVKAFTPFVFKAAYITHTGQNIYLAMDSGPRLTSTGSYLYKISVQDIKNLDDTVVPPSFFDDKLIHIYEDTVRDVALDDDGNGLIAFKNEYPGAPYYDGINTIHNFKVATNARFISQDKLMAVDSTFHDSADNIDAREIQNAVTEGGESFVGVPNPYGSLKIGWDPMGLRIDQTLCDHDFCHYYEITSDGDHSVR